jgi:hypothetical protein
LQYSSRCDLRWRYFERGTFLAIVYEFSLVSEKSSFHYVVDAKKRKRGLTYLALIIHSTHQPQATPTTQPLSSYSISGNAHAKTAVLGPSRQTFCSRRKPLNRNGLRKTIFYDRRFSPKGGGKSNASKIIFSIFFSFCKYIQVKDLRFSHSRKWPVFEIFLWKKGHRAAKMGIMNISSWSPVVGG